MFHRTIKDLILAAGGDRDITERAGLKPTATYAWLRPGSGIPWQHWHAILSSVDDATPSEIYCANVVNRQCRQ